MQDRARTQLEPTKTEPKRRRGGATLNSRSRGSSTIRTSYRSTGPTGAMGSSSARVDSMPLGSRKSLRGELTKLTEPLTPACLEWQSVKKFNCGERKGSQMLEVLQLLLNSFSVRGAFLFSFVQASSATHWPSHQGDAPNDLYRR